MRPCDWLRKSQRDALLEWPYHTHYFQRITEPCPKYALWTHLYGFLVTSVDISSIEPFIAPLFNKACNVAQTSSGRPQRPSCPKKASLPPPQPTCQAPSRTLFYPRRSRHPLLPPLAARRRITGSEGSEFRVQGSGFRVQCSGFRDLSGFRVQGSGFRVQGSGFRVQGIGCRTRCLESGVAWGLGF